MVQNYLVSQKKIKYFAIGLFILFVIFVIFYILRQNKKIDTFQTSAQTIAGLNYVYNDYVVTVINGVKQPSTVLTNSTTYFNYNKLLQLKFYKSLSNITSIQNTDLALTTITDSSLNTYNINTINYKSSNIYLDTYGSMSYVEFLLLIDPYTITSSYPETELSISFFIKPANLTQYAPIMGYKTGFWTLYQNGAGIELRIFDTNYNVRYSANFYNVLTTDWNHICITINYLTTQEDSTNVNDTLITIYYKKITDSVYNINTVLNDYTGFPRPMYTNVVDTLRIGGNVYVYNATSQKQTYYDGFIICCFFSYSVLTLELITALANYCFITIKNISDTISQLQIQSGQTTTTIATTTTKPNVNTNNLNQTGQTNTTIATTTTKPNVNTNNLNQTGQTNITIATTTTKPNVNVNANNQNQTTTTKPNVSPNNLNQTATTYYMIDKSSPSSDSKSPTASRYDIMPDSDNITIQNAKQ